MKKNKTTQQQVGISKKILDRLPDGWADSANSMKEDELKQVIVQCEGNLYLIAQEKEGDANLAKAREEVKNLGAAYRDGKNTQQAKITYALWLLESRGADLDSRDDSQ